MLFQRISRATPERIFVVAKNSYSTASLTNGQAVIWDFTTGDADGASVTIPLARATNAGVAAAGIVAETIAFGGYGLIQVYGYHSAARIRAISGGGNDVAKGSPLALTAAGSLFCLETFATTSTTIAIYPCAFALEVLAAYTTAAKAVFVKAL